MSKLIRQRHLQAALQKTKAYMAQQTARLAQAAAQDLAKQGLGPCTHKKTGTVHGLSAAEDAKNLRFVATADFAAGDAFTLNGRPVAARTLSGEGLFSGCFKKGSVVVCCKEGEALTFGTPGPQALLGQLLDLFYPVGTVYETTNKDFQPAAVWGGSWRLLPAGAALRQAGDGTSGSKPVGTHYGSAQETLSVDQIPNHYHGLPWSHSGSTGAGYGVLLQDANGQLSHNQPYTYWTTSVGRGLPHNNIGPSYALNIWMRVA